VKTNAARILERLGIPFELAEYEVDLEDLSAERVAAKIGMDPESVFKTLVVRGEKQGVMLAVIPASYEVDLKALARAAGDRRAEMVPLAEVEPLTGYVRGAVTAFGTKKKYPVFADELIELSDRISVSAGVRGLQILIAPRDYLRAVEATVAPIGKPRAQRAKRAETGGRALPGRDPRIARYKNPK
jgi:Cys-tRNA(Pro)/Cys-tRNA(Cys) deacylase